MEATQPITRERVTSPIERFFFWGTLGLVTATQLTCLLWPVLALCVWGGAYDDGLAGQPRPFPRVIMVMLAFVLGGSATFVNLVLLACTWRKHERKWVLWVLGVAVALGGSAALWVSSLDFSSERFADGYCDRVKGMKLDFQAVRSWIATLPPKASTSFDPGLEESPWPAELRHLNPDTITVESKTFRRVRDTIVLYWGGERDDDPPCWTLTIGPQDMPPPDHTSAQSPRQITRLVEPGVYVGPDVNMGTDGW